MNLTPTFPTPTISHLHAARLRRLAGTAMAIGVLTLACFALGGCKSVSSGDVTGSIATTETALPQNDAALRQYAEQWGKRFEANEADKVAAINYARALRALTQYGQAVAVLRQTAIKSPEDLQILGAYGKALADAGRLDEAAEVLQRSHTQERPNWTILSAQGAVADKQGDHVTAQGYYLTALKIVPGEPGVLSNLGLSYVLTKQLPQAEQALRQAAQHPAADARVRQNLSLVLALQGKFAEAEQIAARDVGPTQAAQNIATLRKMTAQSNKWRDLQQLDRGAKPRIAAAKPASQIAQRPTTAQTAQAPVDDEQ